MGGPTTPGRERSQDRQREVLDVQEPQKRPETAAVVPWVYHLHPRPSQGRPSPSSSGLASVPGTGNDSASSPLGAVAAGRGDPAAPGAGGTPALSCTVKVNSNGGALAGRSPKARPTGDLRYVAACKQEAWSLSLRHLDKPNVKKVVCFHCGSWRHVGSRCAKWKLYKDYLKIREGLKKNLGRSIYVVLTHQERFAGDRYDHWKDLSRRWDRKLRPRLMYEKRLGRFDYGQTWEQTKKRKAHINMVLYGLGLENVCREPGCPHIFWKDCPNKNPWCRNCGGHGKKARLCQGYRKLKKMITDQAVAAGFGKIVWVAPVTDEGTMAGYLNKMSGANISGEINNSAAKSQLPVDAPPRFRRIRFSRSWPVPEELLPKPKEWTGELVQAPVATVLAAQAIKDQVEVDLPKEVSGGLLRGTFPLQCQEISGRGDQDSGHGNVGGGRLCPGTSRKTTSKAGRREQRQELNNSAIFAETTSVG